MGDGLKFLTLGGSEELIVGNDYAATIGMTNYVYIGTETSFNLGLVNDITLGAKFSLEGGHKFEWTHVGGCSLEDGEVLELGDTVHKQAGQSITLSAGYGVTAQLEAETLAGLKKALKAAVLAMTVVNAGLGLVASATMVGVSDGDNEQEGWLPVVESVSEAVLVGVTTAAVYATVVKAMSALTHTYEHLAKVSTMKMDATGIKQLACFDTTGSSIIMSETGVSVNTGLAGVAKVDPIAGISLVPALSSLSLSEGNAILSGDESVAVKGAASVKVGQMTDLNLGSGLPPDLNLISGLSATEAEVVLKNADTAVTLTALTAGIRSPEVQIIADGVNGFVVNATETQMSFGGAGVRASLAGLKLSMDGGGVLVFQPGVVSVSVFGLLKLG